MTGHKQLFRPRPMTVPQPVRKAAEAAETSDSATDFKELSGPTCASSTNDNRSQRPRFAPAIEQSTACEASRATAIA
ncbi:hypothetical protein [Fulvimarina sp. MAC8]|uniref:hypothetical protein n=1 Tax=Fulvimarina sp. MAC8 TaxID=3162874 RepID=UPI0032EE0FC4